MKWGLLQSLRGTGLRSHKLICQLAKPHTKAMGTISLLLVLPTHMQRELLLYSLPEKCQHHIMNQMWIQQTITKSFGPTLNPKPFKTQFHKDYIGFKNLIGGQERHRALTTAGWWCSDSDLQGWQYFNLCNKQLLSVLLFEETVHTLLQKGLPIIEKRN
jgi:hypothetical protein